MNIKDLFHSLSADLLRYDKKINFLTIFKMLLGIGPTQSIFIYRLSSFFYKNKIPLIHSILTKYNMMFNNIEIAAQAEIGKGLKIAHSSGIVIGKNSKVGEDLTIFHNVTIGAKNPFDGHEKMPEIGSGVTLYTGSTLLGDIKIANNVKVGAHTILIKNVKKENSTVFTKTNIVVHEE